MKINFVIDGAETLFQGFSYHLIDIIVNIDVKVKVFVIVSYFQMASHKLLSVFA